MRRAILVLTGCLLLVTQLQAQPVAKEQVPKEVLSAFNARFPNAENSVWELKKDRYKVEFKIGKRGHDLWLDLKGSVKKHKEDFPKGELPEAIRKKVESDFIGFRIDDADKIEEDGTILYQLDLKSASERRKLLFTAAGEIKENKKD
jgi:hypothetical protein